MSESIQNPREIVHKYFLQGPFKADEITAEETKKNSKQLKDEAWKTMHHLINHYVIQEFYKNLAPGKHKYSFGTKESHYFQGLLFETIRTFRITFILVERGYYRLAFANLRDILEIIMKIKYFYNNTKEFHKWIINPTILTTRDLRKKLIKNKNLENKIEKFSQSLSNNRHSIRHTLDSLGKLITDTSYYRKDLFEKWCKHVIILKDLSIKIIESK